MFRLSFRILAVVVLITLVVLAFRSWVVVDETEFVLLTSFGWTVDLYGDDENEAGLHARWPWHSAWRMDRRIQVNDAPAREVITGDKKNLEIASYFVWRIAEPRTFLNSAGTMETAASRLDERLSAALSDAIGRRDFDQIATTEPATWKLDEITSEVARDVGRQALDEMGVEILDVGLRRFHYPLEVRPAVFDLIRSERRQVAATLRAEGEAAFLDLTSRADRERDEILAEAEAEAERIRGRGEAEAIRILNEIHGRDPEFADFLRTLDAYRAIFDERSTVVLSAASPLLKLLMQGPVATDPSSPSDSGRRVETAGDPPGRSVSLDHESAPAEGIGPTLGRP